jgi:formylglycine-generating enzyme required for sulfatase activity
VQPSSIETASVSTAAPAPPAPPPAESTVDYDDLIKQRAEARKEWAGWQEKMGAEFKKLAEYDASKQLRPPEKADAWAVFLQSYGADNPYSKVDESLRVKAQQKMAYWRAQKTASAAPAASVKRQDKVAMAARPSGKTFTNRVGMKFVLIPPGKFMMGSPEGELGREYYEIRHQVTLTRPFYLAATEVTQRQWKTVMGSNPSTYADCGDGCPVETVSWEMAAEFIRRLNKMEGTDAYRLPTEAEWEYAARAGAQTAYYSGEATQTACESEPALDPVAWHCGNSELKPHPVGQKKPNRWGLYDMHGNVYEWCQDWWYDYTEEAAVDPVGEDAARHRMLRGGCFYYYPTNCRSAYRYYDSPGSAQYYYGFRVARDPR